MTLQKIRQIILTAVAIAMATAAFVPELNAAAAEPPYVETILDADTTAAIAETASGNALSAAAFDDPELNRLFQNNAITARAVSHDIVAIVAILGSTIVPIAVVWIALSYRARRERMRVKALEHAIACNPAVARLMVLEGRRPHIRPGVTWSAIGLGGIIIGIAGDEGFLALCSILPLLIGVAQLIGYAVDWRAYSRTLNLPDDDALSDGMPEPPALK